MISLFESLPSLEPFQKTIEQGSSLFVQGLWDAPKAVLLLLAQKITKKNIVVITGETRENNLIDDLLYFKAQNLYDFPAWEILPGEEIKPSSDIVGKRFEILHSLFWNEKPSIILCPLQSALQKLPKPDHLIPLSASWKVGDELPFRTLETFLKERGYRKCPVAADKGEFAIRGGILDVFPVASPDPFRLDFFGDTIEQIRTYDPIGQKSIGKTDKVFICPADEYALLTQEKTPATLLDYLQAEALLVFDDIIALEDRYITFKGNPAATSHFFLSLEDLLKEKKQKFYFAKEKIEELAGSVSRAGRGIYSGKSTIYNATFEIFHQNTQSDCWNHPFKEICDFFSPFEEKTAANQAEIFLGISQRREPIRLHFISDTASEEKHLRADLQEANVILPEKTFFESGYLSSGVVIDDLALLPMPELTKKQRVRREKWRSTYHTPASEFHELAPGDLVVHFHSGIGKYLGIEKKKNHLGQETEFFVIEYAKGSTLYTPVSQSHLISRYIGATEEIPTLSMLGTSKWQHAKANAQKAIIGYAKELLEVNAARTVAGGFQFSPDSEELKIFESDFPFTETDDQLRAITDIKNDMISGKAMDRLICGDVGYGKTEVAMRAAMKAVLDGGKQVAVLVPTTVLALQHFETFQERMRNFPVRIGLLSRMCPPKEIRKTLQEAQEGKIDIVIGTHRLISGDVAFHNLGLIIIDEEQRFGVKAKEHLKKIKAGVDSLTLSATPIPRTLYLSLVGAKDVSIIATPPQDRLPIKTIIAERDDEFIKNALLRELSRDGQAFFIHNRVESIYHIASELQKLLPHARIAVAHGQMDNDEIDSIFHKFKHGETDILIATTIIENGIDIPNANTILVDRAHHFGMADLYQIRGRVGRWNRPAFAYFLVPRNQSLPEITMKRLRALAETSGYGGGMKIAMRDLEIRGAGDILGTKQSGQISSIGFHLYCKLLKRTVETMQKKIPVSFNETRMEFSYDAKLGEDYIAESSLRLEIYYRLGEATSFADVDAILEELKDRFGPPPPQVIWLYHLTRIRVFASNNQFTLLKFSGNILHVEKQTATKVIEKKLPLIVTPDPKELEDYLIHILSKF
jgi:transcription-repair coupling factor (superfamily II helicase)